MSGLDDLGRALRDDAAANAPRASTINVDAVVRAARARRTPRVIGVGALAVVAALGLGGLALSAFTPPTLIAASESADTIAGDAQPESLGGEGDLARSDGLLACGSTPPAVDGESITVMSLTLSTGSGSDTEFVGVATLSNAGPDSLTLLVPAEATGVFTRGGTVVSTPVPVDRSPTAIELGAGETWEIPVRLTSIACATGQTLTGELEAVVVAEVTIDGSGEQAITLVTATAALTLD